MSADAMHQTPLHDFTAWTALDPEVPNNSVIEPDAREVAYTWDLVTDRICWQAHAAKALELTDLPLPQTGEGFNTLIVDEHVRRRDDVISHSSQTDFGCGVPYRIIYRIAPDGPRSRKLLWIEERGRWWAGKDGRPAEVRGFLRLGREVSAFAHSQAQADYDELTGQLSRMRLTDALSAVMRRISNGNATAAFLMVAVNNLQRVNDSFGYETGDEVIAEVGRRLREQIRAGDTLGRHSANKFGIILADCDHAYVEQTAKRLISSIASEPIVTERCKTAATVSIGAVLLPNHAVTEDLCYGRVLRALDEARFNSRADYAIFEPDVSRDLRRLRSARIADYINRAIDEDRLELALQPICWAASRKPALHECLLRVQDNGDNMFSPADFIPIAEELGLASLIDKRTLELATRMLRAHNWLNLSLNVSALTCHDNDWLRDLTERVTATPDIAKRLVVEITETMAAKDIDEAAYFVDAIRELGCRVAIDDFGAGYTSFANLKRIPADILKIDGSFVTNLMNDRSDQVFVRTMVEIAESFGMETVAEWVDDDATADYVERLGVTYIQGFHFGQPVKIAETIAARAGSTSTEIATATDAALDD